MTAIIAALLPVFLLIATGYGLKWMKFPGDDLWPSLERLVYFLLFPALLGSNLAKADLEGFEVLPLAGVITSALAIMGLVTVGLKRRFGQGPALTSVFQGTVRFNSYVGLAIAAELWGAAGNALGAVVVAIMVPMSNALCVFALARFSGVHPPGARAVFMMMAKNPLIIACLAGFLLNYAGIGLPPVIGPVIEILAQAALPIGILCVGAGLDLSVLRSAGRRVVEASLLRLLGMPLLMFGLCLLFEVSGLTAKVVILMGALPTASSSFILARQMGGDVALMAGIITVSTLAAMVTMPFLLPVLW
jgi:malonate transporter and related proteins